MILKEETREALRKVVAGELRDGEAVNVLRQALQDLHRHDLQRIQDCLLARQAVDAFERRVITDLPGSPVRGSYLSQFT